MSRRLFACLATIFLLIMACHMVMAQTELPALPSEGEQDGTMLPPSPPAVGDQGAVQQDAGIADNGMPANMGTEGDANQPTGRATTAAPVQENQQVIDLEPSPGLKISPVTSTGDNWPMSGRDVTHSCYVPYNLTFPLKLYWKFATKQPSDYPTSPVVADGVMYFATASRLYAMSAETGTLYWKYPEDAGI
ncbi:MAG TPA: PQQ-binding-like beta-propeller repeat protein, partial [Armatimonadota bacterium]